MKSNKIEFYRNYPIPPPWAERHVRPNLKQSPIGLMGQVFTKGLGDWGSIPGGVIPDSKNGT